MNNKIKKHFDIIRLLIVIVVSIASSFTVCAQSVWDVCSGTTHEYAYCSVSPSSPNCNACTLSNVAGDATGYVITRGAFNGAYTTTINWLKAGTYVLYYSCAPTTARTVTVGQGEIRYAVTAGAGTLCGGSRVIRLTNSESGLAYALRKNNTIIGSPKSGAAGTALEWTVTEIGTFDVVAMYGCTTVKTNQPALIGSVTITDAPAYTVSGGGYYCPGYTGPSVLLANSQVNVSYELYKDGVMVMQSTQPGVGGALIWNNLTALGVYTIKALGDCSTRWNMTGQAVITNASPSLFSVSGGGSYCSGGDGASIILSGSQTGVNYQLKKDGVNIDAVVPGTGSALSWTHQIASGSYSVVANSTSCSIAMNGSATITILPLLEGATMSNAINIGDNVSCVTYSNQKNISSANCFGANYGTGGDDVFYKFTTPYNVSLVASNCGTSFNTQLYVFNSVGGVVQSRAMIGATNCQEQNKLQVQLSSGTYYVMSKAATPSDVGPLTTQVAIVMTETFHLSPAYVTIPQDQSVVLTIPSSMTSVSQWLPSGGGIESTTAQSATVRPATTTTYSASGTVNGCPATAQGTVNVQPDNTNRNYVKETMVLLSGIQSLTQLDGLPVEQKSVNTTYVDGLGRKSQTVSWQASPDKKDIVLPFVYDKLGREAFTYAPYASGGNNGLYKINPVGTPTTYSTSPHRAFYMAANDEVANDNQPYAQTIFDTSPMNEIVKQGAIGAAWQPDINVANLADHSVKKIFQNNLETEVFRFTYDVATGGLSLTGNKYYDKGQLTVEITIDEEGKEVRVYTDKDGRVVLKNVEYDTNGALKLYASTYYIYNDTGDLALVLPPQAIKVLTDCSN